MTHELFQISYEIRQAIIAIRFKWFQSLLSILGIAISVASIIVMVSISEGTQENVLKSIKDLGMHTIRIDYKPTATTDKESQNLSSGLLQRDFETISSFIEKQGVVSHTIAFPDHSILTRDGTLATSVYFSDERFLDVERFRLLHGRPILKDDLLNSNSVAIISDFLHNKKHIGLGDYLVHQESSYSVVGISSNNDRLKAYVYLPLSYADIIDQDTHYDQINIYLFETRSILATSRALKELLKRAHRGIEDYQFTIPLEIIKKKQDAQRDLDMVLIVIALMSLLSGGISIMNIMLSNIAEQTREIGLRLALGATQTKIIRFVLIHTVLLSLFAAILGSFVGYVSLLAIVYTAKVHIILSLKAFVLAFAMAIISGVLFGIYPAIRAAKITPMTALREY